MVTGLSAALQEPNRVSLIVEPPFYSGRDPILQRQLPGAGIIS